MFEQSNVIRKLTTLRKRLLDFNKRTVHFRRTPATHVFVLMLSSDICDRKPYALPVQCVPYALPVPYAGFKEVAIRRLITRLCEAMNSYGMKVAGIHYHFAYIIYPFIRFRKRWGIQLLTYERIYMATYCFADTCRCTEEV